MPFVINPDTIIEHIFFPSHRRHSLIIKMTEKQDKLNKFLEWAISNGAEISEQISFKVNEEDSQIYAEANTNISKDSTSPLFSIPECVTINPTLAEEYFGEESSDRTPISKLLLAKLKFDKEATILNVNGKKVDGNVFFKPYLDLLPSGKEIGSPLFWDGNERSLIKGTNAFLSIDKILIEILEEWYQVVSKLKLNKDTSKDLEFYEVFKTGKPEHFATYLNQTEGVSWTSYPAYLWSNSIFTSRAFPYILQKESETGAKKVNSLNEGVLLPIFDLLNHKTDSKIKWNFNNGKYSFKTEYEVAEKAEIFNSYGLKSNETLLFNYGFVLAKNKEDYITLALRVPEDQVSNAMRFGVKGFNGNDIVFNFGDEEGINENIVKLFEYLVKTKDENCVTLRNSLQGLQQLENILESKYEVIKNIKIPPNLDINKSIILNSKNYRNLQKSFLVKKLEIISKTEKNLIKKHKPVSFKSLFKNDTVFANALLLTFGIESYEKLILSENDLNHVLILWILRVHNRNEYKEKNILPEWIFKRYETLLNSTAIQKEDIREFLPSYSSLFPNLSNKIPEVFNKGNWTIRNFIIAEKLKEEIVFIRKSSNEAYFIDYLEI